MRKTQIRAMIATIFAIVVLVLGAAIGTSVLGMNVPILRDISAALGM